MTRARCLVTAVLLALISVGGQASAAGPESVEGTWTARPTWGGESLRLRLRWISEGGRDESRVDLEIPMEEVEGAAAGDFSRPWADLSWKWKRALGTFSFTGEGAWFMRPGGVFTFTPDPSGALQVAGLTPAGGSPVAFMLMALDEVDLSLIQTLADLHYEDIGIDEVTHLSRRGIDAQWVLDIQDLGLRPTVEEMIRLHARGIGSVEARALKAVGIQGLPVDDLITLHARGISAEWLRGMIDAGCEITGIEELVQLHARGLDPATLRGYREAGGFEVDAEAAIQLHTRGVSPAFVQAIASSGLAELDEDKVIRLHQHGVPSDLVATLGRYGISDVDDMIRLRSHGIDTPFVTRLSEAGYTDLTADEMIEIRSRGQEEFLTRRRAP